MGGLHKPLNVEQDIPVSERGKNPVEIILLKEWYVRQTHIQDRMKEHIEEIGFSPVSKPSIFTGLDGQHQH